MRKIVFLTIIALSACAPDYKDRSGSWTFTSTAVSGQFTTSATHVVSGSFQIKGVSYTITQPTEHGTTISLVNVSGPGVNYVDLTGVTVAVDFGSMSATGLNYSGGTDSGTLSEAIQIKRK